MKDKILKKGVGRFWAELDAQHQILIQLTTDQNMNLKDHWHPLLKKAAHDAYAYACPHETPRQIQAFAKGLEKLKFMKFSS